MPSTPERRAEKKSEGEQLLDLLQISDEDRKQLRKGALEFIITVYARRKNFERKIPLSIANLAKLSREMKIAAEIRRKLHAHEKIALEDFQKKYNLSATRISAIAFVYADFILTSPEDVKEVRKDAILAMRDAMKKALKEGKYQAVSNIAAAILEATAPQATENAGDTAQPSTSFIYADFRKMEPATLERVVSQKLRELRATNTSR